MPNLYPSFEVPALSQPKAGLAAPTYGKAWAFDFRTGDFVLDGSGRLVELDGHNAWVQWCLKTVQTQRYAHLIYTNQYGCEVLDAVRTATTRRSAESEVTRVITEALLADARTRTVRDFAFTWAGDELSLSCSVEPVVGSAARLEVVLVG